MTASHDLTGLPGTGLEYAPAPESTSAAPSVRVAAILTRLMTICTASASPARAWPIIQPSTT